MPVRILEKFGEYVSFKIDGLDKKIDHDCWARVYYYHEVYPSDNVFPINFSFNLNQISSKFRLVAREFADKDF